MSVEVSRKSPNRLDLALGAAVRVRRRANGMSQEGLAEQCGISFQQIQKYENGVNRISFSRLVQIARALGCRVAELIDVLDTSGIAGAGHIDVLRQTRSAGALELLDVFERLPTDGRACLLNLMRSLTEAEADGV